MKKLLALLTTLSLLVSLTACGGPEIASGVDPEDDPTVAPTPLPSDTEPEKETQPALPHEETDPSAPEAQTPTEPQPAPDAQHPTEQSQTAVPEASPSTPEPTPVEEKAPGILIAYFTWADNTVVENEDAAIQNALDHYASMGDIGNYDGVDAITSASVVPPGNAAQMANWIQQEVGGDLHSIVVEDPYPSNYDECLDRAADEKADDARPALSSHVENMEDYDIVFLGFPNWWYTLPMPVLSFVDEYDWSGKTVVPFVTHGTGGLSATVRDLTANLPDDVTVLDPIGVSRPGIPHARPDIQAWIAGLDLEG